MTYVAFEGGEGSGKSTQAKILASRLDDAVVTREPGATSLGARLRELLLTTENMAIGARAETLLMAADRAQHVADVVRPALADGKVVISDRSVFSSLAYQGGGRELGIDEVRSINDWVLDGCWPDIVVLLDVDRETARARLHRSLDRLEQASENFHLRVSDSFRQMAADDPQRWIVVPADQPVDDVAVEVWAAISGRLGRSSGS